MRFMVVIPTLCADAQKNYFRRIKQNMNTKRFFALLLALVMVMALVACGPKDDNTPNPDATPDPNANVTPNPEEPTDEPSGDPTVEPTQAPEASRPKPTAEPGENGIEYPEFDVGGVVANLGSSDGGEVSYDVYAGVEGKDYTDPKYYTYRDYTTSTSGLNWSPLQWETNEDSAILDYITDGFYNFALNATADGWAVTMNMAAEMAEDVTAQYVGQYGIQEGDVGKAWRIPLNQLAAWEDGTPINADTYIYSYQQLLDPIQLNRRADSLYAGESRVYGAKEYFYAGTTDFNECAGQYAFADLVKGEDGNYYSPDGNAMYWAVNFPLNEYLGGNTLAAYVGEYGDQYFGMETWEDLVALVDENGLVPINDETYALFAPVTCSNSAWGETEDDLGNYFVAEINYGEYSWDDVGIIKTGDYELVFVYVTPIADPNYYIPYYMSSTYLVYEPLFERCKTYTDANGNVTDDPSKAVNVTNVYGTDLQYTMSYGPYKLSTFQLDKEYKLTRNENWYGYKDGKHLGQYQMDEMVVTVVENTATALMLFEQGNLDNTGLTADDMEKYGTSQYIRYNPQSYTTKLTFNTDEEALAERGTQILGNLYFRKGFSLAINRAEYVQKHTSAASAGYGLLNYMYVYDPFTGASYRGNDAAKDALCCLYGLTYGEDGEYEDIEDAYDAITGYDMEAARECMNIAATQAVNDGLWDGTSNIELTLSVYQSTDDYVKMFNFFKVALEEACVGTPLEGKVTLVMKADEDYYETMYSGLTDIIFSTWGGATYGGFTLLYECYADAGINSDPNQMEYGFDTSKVKVTMTINGVEFTESLQDWARWFDADDITIVSNDGSVTLAPFADYDADSRCAMFAKLEYVYLANYATTPIYYRNSAFLVSQKGDYAVQLYTDLIGFAGMQFYTFNYDDTEWANVVAGGLTY